MTTHPCPGSCGRDVLYQMLACHQCWYALPKDLRNDVWQAFRSYGQGSLPHRAAVAKAVRWYRERVSP